MSLRDEWAARARARREVRNADLGDLIGRNFHEFASIKTASVADHSAVEVAAGMLSRALVSAEVTGTTVPPTWMRDVGTDLMRRGEHLSRIVVHRDTLRLVRQSSWTWEGSSADPDTWTARTVETGPDATSTRLVPYGGLIWLTWTSDPSSPYRGRSPSRWANVTAAAAANIELSLSREASGDTATIIPVPLATQGDDSTTTDNNDANQVDPFAGYRTDLAAAKGRTALVESMANNYDQGGNPPRGDWQPVKLHPEPDQAAVLLAQHAYDRLLAAHGVPPSLASDADGTAQREALRRWHMGVVEPVGRVVAWELSEKLEVPVTVTFDNYALDMVGRIKVAMSAVQMGLSAQQALELADIDT